MSTGSSSFDTSRLQKSVELDIDYTEPASHVVSCWILLSGLAPCRANARENS